MLTINNNSPSSSTQFFNNKKHMNTSSATPTATSASFSSTSALGISAAVISGLNTQMASELNTSIFETGSSVDLMKDESFSDWHPPYPRLCAYHDCHSLAAAWGIGPPTTSLEAARPTGASQAQSPSEDDPGDGKSNALLSSCPAFRNELGNEKVRKLALCRANLPPRPPTANNRHFNQEEDTETWHREHTAAEAGVLEDVSNVYLGGRLCAARQTKIVIEPQDIGSYYFRHCFAGRSHVDYFGTDDHLGPVAISMVRETSERKETNGIVSNTLYRMIVRVSDLLTMRVALPDEALPEVNQERSTRTLIRDLLELVCPQVHFGCLRPALASPKVEELLLKVDEQPIYTRYKVGVLYCRAWQSTEEQMYNNENSSPAFDEFLDFLGSRVRLKNFDAYKGGLDTRGDTTGEYSIYTEYHSHEIMFHISTMLPFTPNNKQQLSRKRHIGNDMVTIIFQEPDALPFSPITVRSHFQHVFIIVRVKNPCTDNVLYDVAVSRAKDVPAFGPPISSGVGYQKCAEFHDFLLTKIINAENAVHRSKKFAAMAARTRREALKDLSENYVTTHSNEGPSRIASRFLGGSVKRKERQMPKPTLGANIRGALSWMVDVLDHCFNQHVACILGISVDSFVLLDVLSGAVLFATPTHSILGWANTESGLKIFYDHGDMLSLRCCGSGSLEAELNSLLRRLEAVTNGEEAKELILRRNKSATDASLGFHIQEEGVVTDVEMYQTAWKAGLRQGSRIVEIEGWAVATLGLDQMRTFLDEHPQVRIMMIAPASDGNPRRGCEDPNCPAVKGQDAQVLTPDTFAKQPLTYQEMFMMRNKELRSSHGSPSTNVDDRFFNFSNKSVQKQDNYRREGRSSLASSDLPESILSDRKKNSTMSASGSLSSTSVPRTVASSTAVTSGQPSHQQKKFNSVHEQLCNASFTELSRTQSDDILGFPTTTIIMPKLSTDDQKSPSSFQSGYQDDLGTILNSSTVGSAPTTIIQMTGCNELGGSSTTENAPVCSSTVGGILISSSGVGGNANSTTERHLSFDDELSKYQWWLQKTLKEKRDLELLNDQLKAQLAMEERAHETTRRRLELLQRRFPWISGAGCDNQEDSEYTSGYHRSTIIHDENYDGRKPPTFDAAEGDEEL